MTTLFRVARLAHLAATLVPALVIEAAVIVGRNRQAARRELTREAGL